MRECKKCFAEKSLEDFPTYRTRTGKLMHRYTCRECFNAVSRLHPNNTPEKKRAKNLMDKYKLTVESYNELAKDGCGVCGTTENLCVDHDHRCCPGKFSCGNCICGVLCDRHNRAEGMLQGDADQALALAAYIIKTREGVNDHHYNQG